MPRAVPAGAVASRWRPPRPLRAAAWIVILLYPVGAGTLLLTADGWAVNRANVHVWYSVTGLFGLTGAITPESFAVLANVALFVPCFTALTVLVPTLWWVLLGAGISVAVELYQGGLEARTQDAGDVVANTLGALLGVLLGLAVRSVARRRAAAPGPTEPTTRDGSPAGSGRARGGALDGHD